jgi:hypothetical protein
VWFPLLDRRWFARARSTACECVHKKAIAFIRTSGVHALFTMRSSSMIDTFMRARVARCGSGEQRAAAVR